MVFNFQFFGGLKIQRIYIKYHDKDTLTARVPNLNNPSMP